MVIPGSTSSALSIVCTVRPYTSPLSPSLSAAYDDSVIVCRRFTSPCCHHPLPCPLPAAAVLFAALHRPVVCSRLPRHQLSTAATIADSCRHRGPLPSVSVPIVKFIKSTYKGPPYKKIGDDAELKAGTTKERPRGHVKSAWST